MNEPTMGKTMTIRELAETAGCSEKTVRRIGKTLFPEAYRKGVKTRLSKDQCFDVMAKLPKRNLVGQMSEVPRTKVQGGVDYEALGSAVAAAVVSAMSQLQTQPSSQKNIRSLPAPQKSTRAELNQVVRQFANDQLDGDFPGAWHRLYAEILYRMHRNVKICAKNEGISAIDYIEREGMLEPAISIMVELMGEAA